MADETSHGVWEHIRLWLAAVAIPVVLAGAGLWQFYLREVLWPVMAINLTADVTVKEAGLSAASIARANNLEAIELTITARNPSPNTVFLCANLWEAWGITIGGQASGDSKDWLGGVKDLLDKRRAPVAGKHFKNENVALVAVGTAFPDSNLRANEKISAAFVFYIPQGLYDAVAVYVNLPTTSKENSARLTESALGVHYEFDDDRSSFHIASVYRIEPDATHKVVSDKVGNLPQSDVRYYGYQIVGSKVELSLWQSGTRPSAATNTEAPETSSR
jgi:hypothetical protein